MTSTTDTSTTAGKIADLRNRLAETGRPTARTRVEQLLDEGSFVETDALARHRSTAFGADRKRPVTDGIVAGHGTIDGRPVCVFSQDSTIFDGQVGETAGEKILKVLELAVKSGTPIIGIYDGTGARVTDGMAALEYFTRIYRLQSLASGVIPQVAVVAGPVAGVQVHGVALSDVVIEVEQDSTAEDIARGVAHVVASTEDEALDLVADVLSYLPSNNRAVPPPADVADPVAASTVLDSVIPDDDATSYPFADILTAVVDGGSALELQRQYAPNMVTALARVHGRSIGVIANQPDSAAGAIDGDAAEKAARFIRFCDAFNVPLVTVVDCPGFAAGEGAELTRRSAKLLGVTAAATVGKIAVVTRKAFGSAYLAFGAKRLGTDLVFAWPTAQIAVADAAEIAAVTGKDEAEIAESLVNPYAAAERGLVDAVIPPSHTRERIAEGLRLLERKAEDLLPRKHDNLPF